MSRLPPKAQLRRVLSALAKYLPDQLQGLIEAPRFDEEQAILERFADSAHGERAVAAMSGAEAQWLADLLTERWAAVGEVVLDPMAAIQAPGEVWLGRRARTLNLEVVVEGLEPGWSAAWQGDVGGNPGEPTVKVEAQPPANGAGISVRVRVEGRNPDGRRTLLVDGVRIALRVPHLVVSEDRRQLLVRDQDGRPAAGVAVRTGNREYRTDAAGRILLDEPAVENGEVLVEGIRAGRIPPA